VALEFLPLIRDEDKIRCVSCGDCVRACLPGVLKLYKQEARLGDIVARFPIPVIQFPEKCDHEGRCLVACPQKVYPALWPQDVDQVKANAEALIAKAKTI
jgi:ferredoxin